LRRICAFDRYSATYGSLGAVIILLLVVLRFPAPVIIRRGDQFSCERDAATGRREPEAKRKGERSPRYTGPTRPSGQGQTSPRHECCSRSANRGHLGDVDFGPFADRGPVAALIGRFPSDPGSTS